MNTRYLLIACLLMLSTGLPAQVRVSVSAGGQFTFLSRNRSSGIRTSGAIMPNGGIAVRITANKLKPPRLFMIYFDSLQSSIETGLVWTNFKYRGRNIEAFDKITGNNLGQVNTHNITYIQLPVYYALKNPRRGWYWATGIFGAYHIADKMTLKQPANTANAQITGTEGINQVIGGFTAKSGREFDRLGINLQFDRIITKIYKKFSQKSFEKGYSIQLELRYFIR